MCGFKTSPKTYLFRQDYNQPVSLSASDYGDFTRIVALYKLYYLLSCIVGWLVDVRSLVLKLDDYQIHDVANALKRFFRTLDSPLLTDELYPQWINAAGLCIDFIIIVNIIIF